MRFLPVATMSPAAIARIAAHPMPIYNVELEDLSRPSFSNWAICNWRTARLCSPSISHL